MAENGGKTGQALAKLLKTGPGAGGPGAGGPGDAKSTGTTSEAEGRREEGRTEEDAKQGIPKLAVVEVPKPKEKKSKKKQDSGPITDVVSIQLFLITIFDFIALRAGAHWKVTQEEAQKVAEPLGRILDRMQKSTVVNENMDYIMLFTAVIMILIPRIMISKTMKPAKEVKKPDEGKTSGGNGGTAGPIPSGTNRPTGGNVKQLFANMGL